MSRKILIICLLFISAKSFGQRRTPWNLRQWDDRKYHFGFTLGFNSATADLKIKDNVIGTDSLLGIIPDRQPGFNLGIVSSVTLHPNLRLRFVPSLSFQDRTIIYTYSSEKPQYQMITKRLESTFVSFPLLLKYRSRRINNTAAYLIAGFKYSMDMASQKDVDNNKSEEVILKMNKNNYSAEIGGGFDFFLMFFKFGLELKADFGIPNLLIQDNTIYSSPLDQLKTRTVFFSLTFEG